MGRIGAALMVAICATAGQAETPNPLSAIDWLSQSVEEQPSVAAAPIRIKEPPIAGSARTPAVTVTALDAPSPDPVGLLPSDVTGLPRDLWAGSDAQTLATLVTAQRIDGLPAAQELLRILILAEADAPLAAGPDGVLFLARIDKLLDMGALDPALEMLNTVDTKTPEVFRRWFDVALLTGAEDDACAYMRDTPSTAPSETTRIFCLARNGDWSAAALTLNTHVALGDISNADADLLARFLDPELYENAPPLAPPARVSPLIFRMKEAIGEGLATQSLPNAFAHADLRSTVGWKSQLEAAERLSRVGAISENTLHGFYTARTPAASGGVWDRAKAIQRLDVAIDAADPTAVGRHLPAAWAAMKEARTEVAFARLFGERLIGLPLTNDAAQIALKLSLLSPAYEDAAHAASAPDYLVDLAMGEPKPRGSNLQKAIAAAFIDAVPDPRLTELAANGKLGEALLQSLASFNIAQNDMSALTEILAFWRSVGLEDLTRRAALQMLILDRRQT